MRLNVSVLRTEKFFGSFDGECFHDIGVVATVVVSFPRITFGVFVRERGGVRFQNGSGNKIFGGDHFQVIFLSLVLLF